MLKNGVLNLTDIRGSYQTGELNFTPKTSIIAYDTLGNEINVATDGNLLSTGDTMGIGVSEAVFIGTDFNGLKIQGLVVSLDTALDDTITSLLIYFTKGIRVDSGVVGAVISRNFFLDQPQRPFATYYTDDTITYCAALIPGQKIIRFVDLLRGYKQDTYFDEIETDYGTGFETMKLNRLKFSCQGNFLAVATDRGIFLFNTQIPEPSTSAELNIDVSYQKFIKIESGVKEIQFSPNEEFLYYADNDNQLFQYNIKNDNTVPIRTNVRDISNLLLSAAGNLLIISGSAGDSSEIYAPVNLSADLYERLSPATRDKLPLYNPGPIYVCGGIYPYVSIDADYSEYVELNTVKMAPDIRYVSENFVFTDQDYIDDNVIYFDKTPGWSMVAADYDVTIVDTAGGNFDLNGINWFGRPILISNKYIRGKDFYFGPNNPVDLVKLLPGDLGLSTDVSIEVTNSQGQMLLEEEFKPVMQVNLNPGSYWYIISDNRLNIYIYGLFIVNK